MTEMITSQYGVQQRRGAWQVMIRAYGTTMIPADKRVHATHDAAVAAATAMQASLDRAMAKPTTTTTPAPAATVTERPTARRGCPHTDVDNAGVCYSCGAYLSHLDVGGFFDPEREVPAVTHAQFAATARRRIMGY